MSAPPVAYCVKCKTKREMQNPQALYNAKGSAYTKGTCPVCGTTLMRFGATEAHVGGERLQSADGEPKTNIEGQGTNDHRPTTADGRKRKAETRRQKAVGARQQAEGSKPKTEGSRDLELSPTRHVRKQRSAVSGPQSSSGNLVIVESPAKARTVGRFLGHGYRVRASIGHIRDLPENKMGVDIEHNFAPHYVIPAKKKEVVKDLRVDAETARQIFLATDPDREGEAISWHLAAALHDALRDKPVHRVEFHEITRDAIDHAFAHPREIDQNRVNAQQARRVLDRIVGYTISPLLRDKVHKKNLSAGRVQSVAVRLVVEREREIQAFVPVEYWSIEAELAKQTADGRPTADRGPQTAGRVVTAVESAAVSGQSSAAEYAPFRAKLIKVGDKDFECHTGEEALKLKETLETCAYAVLDVRQKEVQRNPSPPFITSTMQQEASRKLGFNAKRTMSVAQQLYEGLTLGDEGNVGLITYMRTDSTNIAESARKEAWAFIKEKFGESYLPKTPRFYGKKVAGAQEAHEAIRPTSVFRTPNAIKQYLNADQFKLYDLVWKRFVASQMASALFDTTAVDIGAWQPNHPSTHSPHDFTFRANGSILKFRGFLAVYTEGKDEPSEDDDSNKILPPLARGEPLDLLGIYPEQHFTQPPPRFTEATLIKALEEHGIGRPSTYAPILSTIQERGYIERMPDRRLKPTDLGFLVNDLLVQYFPKQLDVGFTASMEEKLDQVADGETNWVQVLRDFYAPFKATLDRAANDMPNVALPVETTNEVCDKCGSPMVVKHGRFGKFLACSAFPKCRNTRNLSAGGGSTDTGVVCPKCKQGRVLERRSKKGRTFYGCNRYPKCDFATWDKPVKTPCPRCGGMLVEQKKGVKCTQCDYVGEAAVTA